MMKYLAIVLALCSFSLAQCPAGMSSAWSCLDRPGDGSNGEQEIYKPGQVTLSGGNAVITETNTPLNTASGSYFSSDQPSGSYISCTGSGDPGIYSCTSTYTSGFMQWTTFNQQYGDFQIRAKMGQGWPAIWLLGSNCQTSNVTSPDNIGTCGWDTDGSTEIDIAEGRLVAPGANSVLQNVFRASDSSAFTSSASGLSDITANFHVYEVVITSSAIIFKVDGVTTNTRSGNYNDRYVLFIQNAIGGNNGGTPTNFTYPNSTSIDWVKVCSQACSNGTSAGADPVYGTFFDDFAAEQLPNPPTGLTAVVK